MLADRHPEIVITGIHIGTYGADRGSSLGELMERLVADVPVVRFRLSSIEATELDDRLVALLAGAPDRLAPHVHAPLQSGSDRVLKRMGRHWYTSASYAASIERSGEPHADPRTRRGRHRRVPGRDRRRSRGHDAHWSTSCRSRTCTCFRIRRGRAPRRTGFVTACIRRRSRNARRSCATSDVERRRRMPRHGPAGSRTSSSSAAAPNARAVTGDYLDVRIADPSFARGDRFVARLLADGDSLCAVAGAGSGAEHAVSKFFWL